MPESTTGLAASAGGKYDAVTPPKPSLLPADIVKQLAVNLDAEIQKQGSVSPRALLESKLTLL
jgi:hypothetical protein